MRCHPSVNSTSRMTNTAVATRNTTTCRRGMLNTSRRKAPIHVDLCRGRSTICVSSLVPPFPKRSPLGPFAPGAVFCHLSVRETSLFRKGPQSWCQGVGEMAEPLFHSDMEPLAQGHAYSGRNPLTEAFQASYQCRLLPNATAVALIPHPFTGLTCLLLQQPQRPTSVV